MSKIGLLLIHPAVSTIPEMVVNAKADATQKDFKFVDQFLINKVNDGSIELKSDNYDVIRYLTPEKPEDIKFPKKLIELLKDSLKINGKLYGLSDAYKVDAVINGFEIVNEIKNGNEEYYWVKKQENNVVPQTISLKTKTNVSNGSNKKSLPSFKKAPMPTFKRTTPNVEVVKTAVITDDLDDDLEDEDEDDVFSNSSKARFLDLNGDGGNNNDDDDSIDEDDLIDGKIGDVSMIICGKSKTKKKKACKDCTCGMKEEEEQKIDRIRSQQEKVIKFTEDELTEIDFTIDGKKVGGCGSCSLGDAFRCSGCPYLGLPAFKPGEVINLNSISDDL